VETRVQKRLNPLILLVSVLLCTMQVTPGMTQSSETLPISQLEWSQDGSRLVVVTRQNLTIYDASFNVVVSETFPSDLAFITPRIALSPNAERMYVGRQRVRTDPFSLELEQFCAANGSAAACADNATVDTDTLQTLVNLGDIEVYPYTAEWSSDGTAIAFRSNRATSVYSATDGTLLRLFSAPPPVWGYSYEGGVEWSPNNLFFARVGGDQVYILDASTGEIAAQYQFENEQIYDVAWSSDSTKMVFVGRESLVIFDVADGDITTTITLPRESVFDLIWSPDGSQIAINAGSSPEIYIWDMNTGNLIDSYQFSHIIESLAYSPYSGRLMIGLSGRSYPELVDPEFVPISTFMESELGGLIQVVAPAASPERLSALLETCMSDLATLNAGLSLINTQQYGEFAEWVIQQPAAEIDEVCAADLQLIALALSNETTTQSID
jgi:WD40 repeat protein